MPEFGPDVDNLTFSVQYITPKILRVKIGAPGRWEVPRTLFKTEPSILGAHPPLCQPAFIRKSLSPNSRSASLGS